MDHVTNTVSSTTQNTTAVAKGAVSDVLQFKFYKNPVFIGFTLYCIVIFGTYMNMSESTKNSYVFADKFRDKDGHVSWKYLVTYPHDPSKSTSSLVYSMLTPPIMWYLFFFTVFFSNFIDITQVNYQAYFYSTMFSYILLFILFSLHLVIFNYVIKPKNTEIEVAIGDKTKVTKSYEAFYRSQWVLLFTLSPIYVCILVYIMRKVSN
jgi:hypothetical protein